MGVGASEVVADLLAHAGVDVVLGEVGRLDEADVVSLVADGGLAPDRAADVGGLILLADLAVRVSNDVVRVGVDARKPVISATMPVSSRPSRTAHCAAVSPMSWHRQAGPTGPCRVDAVAGLPACVTTRRLLAGVSVFVCGALGSL